MISTQPDKLIDDRWLYEMMRKYTVMYHFEDIKPRLVPPPPYELTEYWKLSKKDKAKRAEKFYAQDVITEYLNLKWEIEVHNYSNYQWLKDILFNYLKTDDFENIKKVTAKMQEFKEAMTQTVNPTKAYQLNWKKEPLLSDDEAADWDE